MSEEEAQIDRIKTKTNKSTEKSDLIESVDKKYFITFKTIKENMIEDAKKRSQAINKTPEEVEKKIREDMDRNELEFPRVSHLYLLITNKTFEFLTKYEEDQDNLEKGRSNFLYLINETRKFRPIILENYQDPETQTQHLFQNQEKLDSAMQHYSRQIEFLRTRFENKIQILSGKGVVQTKEKEILEKLKKEENPLDEEKIVSKKIKKKPILFGQNSLEDENLINILKEKEFSENKHQILNKLKKELHNLELDKAIEYIILINIGYFSSLEPFEGNFNDIDFLSFVVKDLLLTEKYYKFGLISLYLILDKYIIEEKYYNGIRYNNFFFNNLLDQIGINEKVELSHIIIKAIIQNEEISENYQNFHQILNNHLSIDSDKIKEISFNKFFDMIFRNNKDLLDQNLEKFKEFIGNNMTEIFTNKNVLTVFKHLYVNFYDKNDPLFQKINKLIQKSIEDVNNVTQIRELVYCFIGEHWKHPFYKKFYREYFNLMYKLRDKRDIMNMGDLLLLFRFSSLERSENWESTYKPFFEKFLEDFKYFRTRKENNFNEAYGQLEIVVGQRPKGNYIINLEKRKNLLDIDKKALEDKAIKKKFFTFLKPKESFIQEVGNKVNSNLQDKVKKLKEKCARGISAKDCEECEKIPNKICLTKLFSYPLGKEVLPHCGAEFVDCYWISENEGYAIVLKATNLNTQKQYTDAYIQVNKLTQRNTVKIIFFANNKPTSKQFLSEALNLCKANNKLFIVFNKDELIQFLNFYEKTNQPEK